MAYAFHQFPVLAPKKVFYVPMAERKAIPVFTTENDLNIFLSELTDFETEWELHSIIEVLELLKETDIDIVAVNPKLPQDEDTGNTAYFGTTELTKFLTHYTDILNTLFSPENQSASKMEKYYLIPAFVSESERIFPNLVAQDGQEYLPLFDNLDSLSKWYDEPYFSQPFKENNGQVLFLTIHELLHPEDVTNRFENASGITINPLDDLEHYQDTISIWDELSD
ncbi:hypothetical protein [Lactococcus allomyrinae]|uniref:hypothetical protein n=1 Tax=Lactococcus allomyrinae TaxID=2419773 RepID=UPI001F08BC49|nr:hypothetical protein [Lactococcus allomyrinae]